jgi:hypothetical protein
MQQSLDTALPPAAVFASLPEAVQQLVAAVRMLYKGSWDDCAEDIRRRQAGRPYLYRLNMALDEPLGWLAKCKSYELARGEPLGDHALFKDTFATEMAEGIR